MHVVKLFLLGRPGCGKSTAEKHIEKFIKSNRLPWITSNFKDYDILFDMAKKDMLHKKFVIHDKNSFDVLDASELDEAIHELEKIVSKHHNEIVIHQFDKNHLIIIELARENYYDAFKQFSANFLEDSYFLLIDTAFEECRKRIEKRVKAAEPDDLDNHNISEFVMKRYYRKQQPLTQEDLLPRFQILDNNGSSDNFIREVETFIQQVVNIH